MLSQLGVYLITLFSCELGGKYNLCIYEDIKAFRANEGKLQFMTWSVRQEREIDCLPQLPKDNLSMVTLNTQLHKQLLMLVYFKVFTYSMQCVQQLKEEV